MPGAPTRLGPFAGGLNTLSDPTAVADSELVDCVNFELDLDGSLVSRPPITLEGDTPGANPMRLLGYYVSTDGTYYLLGGSDGSTYHYRNGVWTLITATFEAVAFCQFMDKAWLLAGNGSANPGGSWTPSGGFVAVAAIPKGSSIISHKNRLWVSPGKTATTNGSRLKFSSVTDPTVWNASDFLDVGQGDGQNITDIVVNQNSIVVFKNDSTHIYSYDSAPDKGSVQRISATQGASDINCVVPYENTLLVYHEGNIYEIMNYNFSRINTKVPFTVDEDPVPPTFEQTVSMSLFNDRLIVRHFNRIYVYNLRTRTWSRWTSDRIFAYFVVEPKNNLITDVPSAYAGSATTGVSELYKIEDAFTADRSENMVCSLRTKNYDYQISSNFKKLSWWGADVLAQGYVEVVANPIIFSFTVTWDQLALVTWDDFGSWDQMLSSLPVVADAVNAQGSGSRKFLKFMKALRFRQIFFTVSIENDGTSDTAPCRVFNLTTYIQTKQSSSQRIS